MLRVPFNPAAKQIAPGLLEVATLVALGAWVGVVAMFALVVRERARLITGAAYVADDCAWIYCLKAECVATQRGVGAAEFE